MKFLDNTVYTNDCEAVILLNDSFGRSPYYIKFEIIHDNYGIPERCEIISFCPTKQNENLTPKKIYWGWYVKWGGYPEFVQSTVIPISDDDRKYEYICTVNNNWGDSGNCNIFFLFKKDTKELEIEDVYMEASCS